jgi:predicted esterase
MNLRSYNIRVTKTARYFILGEPSEKVESVWIVLHGFKQLAGGFIKYFKTVADKNTLIIAPEALNKFYLEGFNGGVGATWMTKENRENEIIDYVNYLDSVYDEVIKCGMFSRANVTVLGFSQGAATACRWFVIGKSKINRLILWGGGIPPDVDLAASKELFNSSEFSITAGDKDEFISSELLKEELKKLDENKILYKFYGFTGGHEINAEILRQLKHS